MKDVMLDFETLGNGKDKCLCQVGAVYFDQQTGMLGDSYEAVIDAGTHAALGGQLDAKTVYWWLQQSDAARKEILKPGRDIQVVMSELNSFLQKATRIWSHATFDFVTLMETLKQCRITPTFSYKAGMDLRTLVYLARTDTHVERLGTHHNALDDCKTQVQYAVKAMNSLKGDRNLLVKLSRFLHNPDTNK